MPVTDYLNLISSAITWSDSIIAINGTSSSPGSPLPSPSASHSTGSSTGSPTSSYLSPSSLSTHSPTSSPFLPGLYNDSESTLFFNITTNGTLYDSQDEASYRSLIFTLITSLTLGALILSTVIGNLFVMVAIWIDRNLQNIQNYLVASLAAADFMVACLVMPLGALYEVQGEWSLGSLLCDIWTSADVLCCTASILHLVAIALDRYWAVNSVTYMHSRGSIVSIGPILGWKDPDYERRVTIEKRCLISQHMGYQIFATISTFYGPLMVILFLYWRIYKVRRKKRFS
uniref:G-protein coupled receptors family 1 profile domain-containing protein n=1 Tax=Tetranychus urticae TaxID=32264 RepID=T1K090_TETUR